MSVIDYDDEDLDQIVATRGRTRPRGFIEDWNPQPQSLALLEQIDKVLETYKAYLPLTVRQIFYRLVARFAYEKTELAYKRLGNLLNIARRARRIDMDDIRDDGFVRHHPYFEDGTDSFFETIKRLAAKLRLDRQDGQERRLVMFCEAAGMAPQLFGLTGPYGIEVLSSGGFSSVTDTHNFAERWANQSVLMFQIGDYDPSGQHITLHQREDIEAFALEYDCDIEFKRLAITRVQARALGLESAFRKKGDKRAFTGDETYQVEAIDPADLARIVRDAIHEHLDLDAYNEMLKKEEETRQEIRRRLLKGTAPRRPTRKE